ncbi:MAG: response regulator [Fimbriimonas sp.]|nr:response regulator [Fimbriimonas sp.]
MRILVIDDEPNELKLADHVLSADGHIVSRLNRAESAMLSIERDQPELILLDMSLPGMDGLALVRLLRSNPSTADLVIVAVTGYPEKYSRVLALQSGCDAYLSKPLSPRTLSQDLAQVVVGSRENKR